MHRGGVRHNGTLFTQALIYVTTARLVDSTIEHTEWYRPLRAATKQEDPLISAMDGRECDRQTDRRHLVQTASASGLCAYQTPRFKLPRFAVQWVSLHLALKFSHLGNGSQLIGRSSKVIPKLSVSLSCLTINPTVHSTRPPRPFTTSVPRVLKWYS